MIIIISGASHTGKTLLSQKLLEKYKFPYLSLDLLKMGLIRSGNTALTPEDDRELTPYLWGIVKEIIKTAIENRQNLIVEGCYVPFDWKKDFDKDYLSEIRCFFIVMTEKYIRNSFSDIISHENDIEQRLFAEDITEEELIRENNFYLRGEEEYNNEIILIEDKYQTDIEI